MEKVELKPGIWVVVCDGRKALILENHGDEKFPNLRARETHEQENPSTSEQGADRPGRVHESVGPGRSAVGQTDWHDQAETEFLKGLVERLEEAVRKKETEMLVVVAAPRALGVLRHEYGHGVKDALAGEIDKDMVNMPVYEIEKSIAEAA